MVLGTALFNQKKLEQARASFQLALREERGKRAAQQWIRYLDNEMLRRDLLNQELPEVAPRHRDAILDALENK